MRSYRRLLAACVLSLSVFAARPETQPTPAPPAAAQPAAEPEPSDPLGRRTPRGTVLGFLNAARKGENALARQYLDTRLGERGADALAHQLFTVLDAKLPARLTLISDHPDGSRANPLTPDRELIGRIPRESGAVDVFVDRIQQAKTGPIWLFSSTTLESIPALYEEVRVDQGDTVLPRFLTRLRIGGVRIADWLALLLGIPIFYLVTTLLNRALVPVGRLVRRRILGQSAKPDRNVLPIPVRLLILALVGGWLVATLPLSLLVRQFWSNLAGLITIVAVVWLFMLVTEEVEDYIHRHAPRSNVPAGRSLLRILRRAVDILVIFVGLMVTLRYFGIDPTPALAGLGVGGIAVALAAQKTLENVIAGASLIFDQAVRVGDFLKMGEIQGVVDHIGLRSTRIRTLDRSIVSVPNSQIANASLESFSARDKFWFHPVVGLCYETTPEQLHTVVNDLRRMLAQHPAVDLESVRVRFIRLGSFSLDVEVFAYLFARDWNHFLEIQEQLLFGVTEIVERAGTRIAFPTQTMRLVEERATATADPRREPVRAIDSRTAV
jgi:MscS family membrane protein